MERVLLAICLLLTCSVSAKAATKEECIDATKRLDRRLVMIQQAYDMHVARFNETTTDEDKRGYYAGEMEEVKTDLEKKARDDQGLLLAQCMRAYSCQAANRNRDSANTSTYTDLMQHYFRTCKR